MLFQEMRQILHRLRKRFRLREHDDSKPQILMPIESAARDDQHMLFMQELHCKIMRILEIELPLFQSRE